MGFSCFCFSTFENTLHMGNMPFCFMQTKHCIHRMRDMDTYKKLNLCTFFVHLLRLYLKTTKFHCCNLQVQFICFYCKNYELLLLNFVTQSIQNLTRVWFEEKKKSFKSYLSVSLLLNLAWFESWFGTSSSNTYLPYDFPKKNIDFCFRFILNPYCFQLFFLTLLFLPFYVFY